MNMRPAGFTLIELLVVILIVGLLAAVAIPRVDTARQEAHFASIGQDLRNLGASQETYYQRESGYAQDVAELRFIPSEGVEVEVIPQASVRGWAATATHASLDPGRGCGIYLGEADPPPLPNGEVHSSGEGALQCAR